MRRPLALLLLLLAAMPLARGADIDPPDTVPQVLLLLRLPAEHYRPDAAYAGGYAGGPAHGARRRIAGALAREHGLALASDWPMPLLGLDCYVLSLPSGQSPERVAEALSRDPRVEWAQPMNLYHARGHNDPLYPVQPAAQTWHLSALHQLSTGRDVRIAVIDSGIDEQHPDLAGQVVLRDNFVDGRPFVAEQHGTAVAGIIAARADDGIGIAGVAPHARLLALRACWEQSAQATLCTSLGLAMALHFAIAHDAGVINLSLSGPPDRLLDKLLGKALSHGITIVGAVDPHLPGGGFPASRPGVIAVTDDTADAVHAGKLLAPGHDVPTTLPGAHWGFVSGASYAAAHVAGLFALLREHRPPQAPPLSIASVVSFRGGNIDACATLTHAAGIGSCAPTVTRAMPPLARR